MEFFWWFIIADNDFFFFLMKIGNFWFIFLIYIFIIIYEDKDNLFKYCFSL